MQGMGDRQGEGQSFLEMIETRVLPSSVLKVFFQDYPFSSTLDEGEIPPVESRFAQALLKQVLPQIVPQFRGKTLLPKDLSYLWGRRGLGLMMQKAHCRWRETYASAVRRIIDSLLPLDATGSSARKAHTILVLTEVGAPCRPASHMEILLGVYAALFLSPDRASGIEEEEDNGSGAEEDRLCKHLHGRKIRDIFGIREEAFVLMVIRKHLVDRFGFAAFGGDWPLFEEDPVLQADVRNPRLIPHDDVMPDSVLQLQDAWYHRRLMGMLTMQDDLRGASILAKLHDVFSFPAKRKQAGGTSSASRRRRKRLRGDPSNEA